MKISLFGATGKLGGECLRQLLAAGHDVTVLVRCADKLPAALAAKVTVVEGDALDANTVAGVIDRQTDAVLFAIGVDKNSPRDLCTDTTKNIFAAMRATGVKRFIWCGGGSTFVPEDSITFGAHVVRKFAHWFICRLV